MFKTKSSVVLSRPSFGCTVPVEDVRRVMSHDTLLTKSTSIYMYVS